MINAVKNFIRPCNITELRSFLGIVGYYRKFIYNFAIITSPLNKLLRKNVSFIWTEKQHVIFDKLKKKIIIQSPILAFSRLQYKKKIIIRAKTSKDGQEHLVHFVCRTLEKAEKIIITQT